MKSARRLTVSGEPAGASMPLYKGWNLVGYNAPFAQSVETALESLGDDCLSVWSFQTGTWRLYDPKNPLYNDLTELTPGDGYWIETGRDCQWRLP
jgi:hypothetical protein